MIEREKQKLNMKYLMKVQKNAPQYYRQAIVQQNSEFDNNGNYVVPTGEFNNTDSQLSRR